MTPSAEAAVRGLGHPRLRYVHEPTPGIAAARNRGLVETVGSDLIVFIDDDERPEPGWLQRLVETQRATGAAAVAGPVVSAFEGELDPWIVAGRYFERRRHATGTVVPVAATNNLLLVRSLIETAGLRFDEEFGLSGGSDSVFTRALASAGGRIVWCDEAVVVDMVPASRANRSWVRRRAFRMGNTEARAQIHVAQGPARALERVRALGRGLSRVAVGGARWAAGRALRSVEQEARGQRAFLRGAGMVLAATGYKYFEYRRPAPEVRPAEVPETVRVLESFRNPSASTNPYIWQLRDALTRTEGITLLTFGWRSALFGRWDVFHVHWADTTWASGNPVRRRAKQLAFAVLLLRVLLTRAPVVQTYHNVATHEGQDAVARLLFAGLRRLTSSYILLNGESQPPGGRAAALIPHGHYIDWYSPIPPAQRVSGRVATFGAIRPYKGVEDLIEAFTSWTRPGVSLVVGGKPKDDATSQRLRLLAGGDERVVLQLQFLDDAELVQLVTEAELMAFPYREMHNSGAVLAALSLARPVLVPRNAVNEALRDEVGDRWVQLFDGALTRAALENALDAVRSIPIGERPDLSRRDWGAAGAEHRDVFRSAVEHRRVPGIARRSRPAG